MKLAGLHENANAFFEAAKRCGWSRLKGQSPTKENEPLLVPEKANMAFACELYLKAIAEATKVDTGKIHDLNKIFGKLQEKDRNEI